MAQKPVEVSSGESRGEGEEEEDSEKTLEEVGETSPLSKAEILRPLPDDAEADAFQGEREQPLIPTKGRSSLVTRGAASTPNTSWCWIWFCLRTAWRRRSPNACSLGPDDVRLQASQAVSGIRRGGSVSGLSFALPLLVLVVS